MRVPDGYVDGEEHVPAAQQEITAPQNWDKAAITWLGTIPPDKLRMYIGMLNTGHLNAEVQGNMMTVTRQIPRLGDTPRLVQVIRAIVQNHMGRYRFE